MSVSDWYDVDEIARLNTQNAQLQAEVLRLRTEMLRTAASVTASSEAGASEGTGRENTEGPANRAGVPEA